MNNIEHQRDHFNKIAVEYYTARKNKNHLRYKNRLFQYALKNVWEDTRKKVIVLEPMCGYGEGKSIVEQYLTGNIDYEGFDYSDTLVNEIKSSNPEMNVWKQNVISFVPEAKKYDIIILIGGLHHVPNHAHSVVEKLSAGLKAGGVFINFEPTNNNFAITVVRKLIYKRNHLFDEETERAFSLSEYNRMFEDAGFIKAKQFYPGLIGYIMYYNPDAFPALNRGNEKTVDRIFKLEHFLYSNWIGRMFSFCTFSVFRKQ